MHCSFWLKKEVFWPLDYIDCIRSQQFSFSVRSCNIWALGRVILCGDAAHAFLPRKYLLRSPLIPLWWIITVGGQGIASDFGDTISLSWRLKLAIGPSFSNHEVLFQGWYNERKQQNERSLASTIGNEYRYGQFHTLDKLMNVSDAEFVVYGGVLAASSAEISTASVSKAKIIRVLGAGLHSCRADWNCTNAGFQEVTAIALQYRSNKGRSGGCSAPCHRQMR